MPIPADFKELSGLFGRLGARDPDAWAKSQVDEGINQLHRFVFLRQAWERVVSEQDDRWMDAHISEAKNNPDQPFSGIGHALASMLAAGVPRQDVTDLVRGMQADLLFQICYLLEDPSIDEDEIEELGWSLVETDEDLQPTGKTIGGLHESVLGMDPTGREMRPRAR